MARAIRHDEADLLSAHFAPHSRVLGGSREQPLSSSFGPRQRARLRRPRFRRAAAAAAERPSAGAQLGTTAPPLVDPTWLKRSSARR